ncbi:MAG: chromosome partitioning ATPase, partial [Casimicrobiaceae bacterium]
MSIIEQAAKRLEELRRAGFGSPAASADTVAAADGAPSLIERAAAQHALRTLRPVGPGDSERGESVALAPATADAGGHSRQMQIDFARLAAVGIVTPDAPRSQVADEFRVVKRPLILNATGKSAAPIR